MRLRFDHGTILIERTDDAEALPDLPGVRWDPRVGRARAPARCHPTIVAELVRLGVRFEDGVRNPAGQPDALRPPTLRPYQEAALAAWERAGRRGVVALPTGSGKTQLALAAIARSRAATLVLVPTRVLVEQWCAAIEAVFGEPPGVQGDGQHTIDRVTVATFESAWRTMPGLGNRFDLLVVDEAHHFGGGQRDDALEMSVARDRLGLTATPPSGAAGVRLAELVGPTVFSLAVGDLAGSWLAGLDVVRLLLALELDERAAYDAAIAPFRAVMDRWSALEPSGSWQDFVRWAGRSDEGHRGLAGWRRACELISYPRAKRAAVAELLVRHRDARVLVFTGDNRTAYAIARGHLVMPITCDIRRGERDAAIAAFRAGELRTLVSARVLNEGVDVPDADVGIIVGGTLGAREHVQRVGRLLRPRDGKRALVYELVARDTLETRQSRRRGEGLGGGTDAAG